MWCNRVKEWKTQRTWFYIVSATHSKMSLSSWRSPTFSFEFFTHLRSSSLQDPVSDLSLIRLIRLTKCYNNNLLSRSSRYLYWSDLQDLISVGMVITVGLVPLHVLSCDLNVKNLYPNSSLCHTVFSNHISMTPFFVHYCSWSRLMETHWSSILYKNCFHIFLVFMSTSWKFSGKYKGIQQFVWFDAEFF